MATRGVVRVAAITILTVLAAACSRGSEPRPELAPERGRSDRPDAGTGDPPSSRPDDGPARIFARPRDRVSGKVRYRLSSLDVEPGREVLLYVSPDLQPDRPAPLIVTLHGAGGDAMGALGAVRKQMHGDPVILVSPKSAGRTWDVIEGGFGPDVELIDGALEIVFDRYTVDTGRVAIEGFSDGASYALSLGLSNGDLFTHVMAFSPGFAAPEARAGEPKLFIAHGTDDQVLPIDATSRNIVPALRSAGLEVRYEEFSGGHTRRPNLVDEAMDWFLSDA
jgi:phospholipase/carboxylesterase